MKRIKLNYLMLLMMAFSAVYATAYDFKVDGIYYNRSGDNAIVTYKSFSSSYPFYYSDYAGNVDIPNTVTYNGTTYTVSAVGDNAFSGCSELTSVTIPNSVTSIGNTAFSDCTQLSSITIPILVSSIGELAFNNCSGLSSMVVVSDNITYNSKNNCNAIIETASNTLIAGCKNTIVPSTVTASGWGAFCGCTGLTSITIPNSVIDISGSAFAGCIGLTSITIPNSVTSIGYLAFGGCTGLKNVNIPNSVISIGDYSFHGCNGLSSITIPNSVISIGADAFKKCTKLTSVTIGNNVTSIGNQAFNLCEILSDIICFAETPPVIGGENCFYPSYTFATLHVPEHSLETYKTTPYWIRFSNIIGDAQEGGSSVDPDYLKCDVNSDGEVNIADVNQVIDAILSH